MLNAVTPDEVTQALITLNLAHQAKVRNIVYFSVIHSDLYSNVPHFTGKYTVERMIDQLDIPATILRPAYFMQNDAGVKDVLTGYGVYPMPVGQVGMSMIDVRDIAEDAKNVPGRPPPAGTSGRLWLPINFNVGSDTPQICRATFNFEGNLVGVIRQNVNSKYLGVLKTTQTM